MLKITNQKEFESLLKICRKHGVRTLKLEGIECTIESEAPKTESSKASDASNGFDLDNLTEDQIAAWSVPNQEY